MLITYKLLSNTRHLAEQSIFYYNNTDIIILILYHDFMMCYKKDGII